jgi:hypothetical protein
MSVSAPTMLTTRVSPPVLGGVAAASADGVVIFAGTTPFLVMNESWSRVSQTYKGDFVDFVMDE